MGAEDIEYMGNFKEFPTKESALDWLDNYLSLDERNNLIRALQEIVLEKIIKKIEFEEKWLMQIYSKEGKISLEDIEIAMSGIRSVISEQKRRKTK